MQLNRQVQTHSSFTSQGIGVKFAGEQLNGPADWAFSENHHVIVVHRAGVLDRLSSQFSTGCQRRNILPQRAIAG